MNNFVLLIGGELEEIIEHNKITQEQYFKSMKQLHEQRCIKIENFIYVDQLGKKGFLCL